MPDAWEMSGTMHKIHVSLLLGLTHGLLAASTAAAAPVLRYQTDVRGNFVIFGNTLGYDCASGVPAPGLGTVNNCGNNSSDTAPDIFWSSDTPSTGRAYADTSVGTSTKTGRSTAVLALPANANIVYARLYWAAESANATPGSTATLERPAASFSRTLTADAN